MVQELNPSTTHYNNLLCTSVGKWDNLFTTVMMFTNTGDSDLAITNMEGYYCTTGGRGLLVGVAVKHTADFHRRWIG